MLDGVQFPDLNSKIATFDGEGSVSRNAVLVNFVNSCVSACSGTPVICAMKGEAAAGGSSEIYNGSLWSANAYAFAVDLSSLKADFKRQLPRLKESNRNQSLGLKCRQHIYFNKVNKGR